MGCCGKQEDIALPISRCFMIMANGKKLSIIPHCTPEFNRSEEFVKPVARRALRLPKHLPI